MRLFRQIVAFVLLALWMPATQHCGLEAAGLITADFGGESVVCCGPTEAACASDSCHVIERLAPKTSNELVQVPTPDFVACVCFLCIQHIHRPLSVELHASVVATDQPKGWVPTWHFARRAAPLSRAPSTLI